MVKRRRHRELAIEVDIPNPGSDGAIGVNGNRNHHTSTEPSSL
jgi:hypothetical protein